ncbi:MAG: hypothetical protein EHM32_09695 [Spirochaetales bacterium]|nr:MAG: hypothetical protein EHM32_09695 [Spirochaetales bacterium]
MPGIEEIKNGLKKKFKDAVVAVEEQNPTRLFVDIKSAKVRQISNEIIAMGGRYLVSIGYDNISRDKTLGMIHTFGFDKDGILLSLRTSVPESKPVMDSITPDIPNAGWSEREYMDLLGMKFTGHPKPKRLILADDWPEGVYPLCKDVKLNKEEPEAKEAK